MNFPLNAEQIAKAIHCPVANVSANWPLIRMCLVSIGADSNECAIAALATIAVETEWTFKPIREIGSVEYFTKHYENRKDLGNTKPGDGARFCGRGFSMLTGRGAYERAGIRLAFNLVDYPDKALDPVNAAALFGMFFHDKGVAIAANLKDWNRVRRIWNGGTNGLHEFLGCVERLQMAIASSQNTQKVNA